MYEGSKGKVFLAKSYDLKKTTLYIPYLVQIH